MRFVNGKPTQTLSPRKTSCLAVRVVVWVYPSLEGSDAGKSATVLLSMEGSSAPLSILLLSFSST